MTVTIKIQRTPRYQGWQRLPHGPNVAPRRLQQARPWRERLQPKWGTSAAVAACGLLALAVRWPGF